MSDLTERMAGIEATLKTLQEQWSERFRSLEMQMNLHFTRLENHMKWMFGAQVAMVLGLVGLFWKH